MKAIGYRKIFFCLLGLAAILFCAAEAFAAAPSLTGNELGDGILSTVIYSVLGIIMAFFSFKVIDLITPGNLSRDIAENNNIALAILSGSIVLGVSIIIAAVLAS